MALKDLIVDQKQISHDMVENILKTRVELIKETKGVNLTKTGQKYGNKTKVLLILCGKKAWELLESSSTKITTSIDELVQSLGINSSTLRGVLKDLKDDSLANAENSKYYITPKGVSQLEEWIKVDLSSLKPSSTSPSNNGPKKTSRSFGRVVILENFRNASSKKEYLEYIENLYPVWGKLTNPQKYLLAIYIAQEKMGVEAVTPGEINFLLSERPINLGKFYNTNISRDLGQMREFVLSVPAKDTQGFPYRLTRKGEDKVKHLITEASKHSKAN